MLQHPDLPTDRPFLASTFTGLGLTGRELRVAESEGMVRRLFRGVYVHSDVPDTVEMRAAALSLVVPTSAVVVDRTAAWLHGVDVMPRDLGADPPIQMYQRDGTRIRRPGVDGGLRQLSSLDVTIVRGLSVTAPLRTALDLGRRLWRFDALGVLDQFARLGVSTDHMVAELPRFRGHRGVVQLRNLVPLVDARAESMAESALRLHWYDAGLPRPEVQWRLTRDGIEIFRLDLALPDEGYAAEYDGRAFHGDEWQSEADVARRALISREWRFDTDVFTSDDVYSPSGDPLARLVTGRRRARTRRGLSPYA